jgi:hypothetical protein
MYLLGLFGPRRFFSVCLFFFLLQSAHAANITLTPSFGSYKAGSTFSVTLNITSNQDAINAVSASLHFNSDVLSLQSVSKTGSIITVWAEEPVFSNSDGTASMEGVIFNPGFSGATGKVATLSFKARKAGTANITVSSGSVLANDGNATNVVKTLGSASFSVTEAIPSNSSPSTGNTAEPAVDIKSTIKASISSTSYPDSLAWYNNKKAFFSWTISSPALSIRTLSNSDPFSTPTKISNPSTLSTEFAVQSDGVHYMHVQARDAAGYGPVAHYKFQIDTHPPENVSVSFPESSTSGNPNPVLRVTAEDSLSGLASVEVVIDGVSTLYPISDMNTYVLKDQIPGSHTGVVNVKDRAGNMTSQAISFTVVEVKAPEILSYTRNATVGDAVRISGKTYPRAQVEVVYADIKTDKTYAQKTTAEEDGSFAVTWEKSLPVGVYEMKAHVIDSKGVTGAYSGPRAVQMERQPYLVFGVRVLNWISLIFLLILAGFGLAALTWYLYAWFGRWKRKVGSAVSDPKIISSQIAPETKVPLEPFQVRLPHK